MNYRSGASEAGSKVWDWSKESFEVDLDRLVHSRGSYILCHTLLCHTPFFCLFCQKIAPMFCVIHEVTYCVIHFFTITFLCHTPTKQPYILSYFMMLL